MEMKQKKLFALIPKKYEACTPCLLVSRRDPGFACYPCVWKLDKAECDKIRGV